MAVLPACRALEMKADLLRHASSFIGGKWIHPSTAIVELESPGNRAMIGARYFPASEGESVMAMGSAGRSFGDWSEVKIQQRIELLRSLLERIERHADRFVKIIRLENGKTLSEAIREVEGGLSDAHFQLAFAEECADSGIARFDGGTLFEGEWQEPVGVFALITPWNFPLATVLRKLVPALAFGNTVVVKPSELTPLSAIALFEEIDKVPFPVGVANLVLGDGIQVGAKILEHDSLCGISFTGSTENGIDIANSVAGRRVRLQFELGGKNTLVVLGDAEVEAAVEAALIGGFSCSGQWCTGTGRVVVEKAIYDQFCKKLIDRVERIELGAEDSEATFVVGPLVSKERVQAACSVVEKAEAQGAYVACGGNPTDVVRGIRGHYFEATLLLDVSEESEAFQEELFLPILPVAKAEDFDDALRMANLGNRGLSASVFTRDKVLGERFLRSVQAGMVHLNLPTSYRSPRFAVSGWKDSGRGYAECGRHSREFFTQPRAVYMKTN